MYAERRYLTPMMTEREIFAEVCELADAGEQAAYLARVCGENLKLREHIAQLLEISKSATSLLDSSPFAALGGEMPAPIGLAALQPFLAPSERSDSLGLLGHYEILEFLGQGGFGVVCKAFDTVLHRVVAVKVLAPHLAATSPPRKLFLREARAAAQVQHSSVVQIFAVEEQPLPYLVMEYVAGQTLQQRLDQVGPLEPDEIVQIGRQVSLGLAAAHEKGLVHRDVKPANIMLQSGAQAQVKLTDFGIARAGDEASLTQSGLIAGTPLFMSPEQAKGEEVDHRADLFSFGSVLYTLVCGHPPFRAPTAFGVLKRVAEDRPRPLLQLVPDIPPQLNAIIFKLLEKNPAHRYSSAQAVADDLARVGMDAGHRVPTAPKWAVAAAATVAIALAGGWALRGFLAASNPVESDHLFAAKSNASSVNAEKSPLLAEVETNVLAPLDRDPWSLEVAAMKPEQQTAAVIARLKELNPQLQPEISFAPKIEDEIVKALRIDRCGGLNDLTPIRALYTLEALRLSGGGAADLRPLRGLKLKHFETNGSPITDLSPLAGMPLETLSLWAFATADLSPFAGMRLKFVNLGGSPVKDLSVLRGMPLEYLCLNYSQVEDLSPLEGAPLNTLECENVPVKSIQPLSGSTIESLFLNGTQIEDFSSLATLRLKEIRMPDPLRHAEILRSIPTLEKVNGRPVAEILGNAP